MGAFVKLWEDIIYHPVWQDDPIAWKIFEYLLVSSYRGTPQGTTVKTTQQITNVCFGGSGKNSTTYKAIKRLEKYEMVKTKSTNRKTEFQIINWWKYQGKESNGKNEVKTREEPSNTLNKNKDIRIKTTNVGDYGNPQINEVVKCFEENFGFSLTRKQLNRQAAYRLLNKYGLEKVLKAIKAAYEVQADQYAPGISNLLDLEEKLPRLAKYYNNRTSVDLDKQLKQGVKL